MNIPHQNYRETNTEKRIRLAQMAKENKNFFEYMIMAFAVLAIIFFCSGCSHNDAAVIVKANTVPNYELMAYKQKHQDGVSYHTSSTPEGYWGK